MRIAACRALFIAGAGTEIGKTYVTAALTRRLREEGRAVLALKPLASGVPPLDDPAFADSDTAILLAAQDLPVTPETVEACSPWRFSAPLAPDQAAAREGRTLHLDQLVAWCEARVSAHRHAHPEASGCGPAEASQRPRHDVERTSGVWPLPLLQDGGPGETSVLIEGVGGLMSPITEDATGLDWLKRLGLPTLLVSGSYLGAISHALTAVETLRAHGVPLAALIVSENEGAPTPPEIVAAAIARRIAAPVAVLCRGGSWPDAPTGFVEPASVVPTASA